MTTRLEGVTEAAARTEAYLKQCLEEERAASAALAVRAEAVQAAARAEIESSRAEIERLRAAATTFERQLAALEGQSERSRSLEHELSISARELHALRGSMAILEERARAVEAVAPAREPGSATSAAALHASAHHSATSAGAAASSASALATALHASAHHSAAASSASALATAHATIRQQHATIAALQRRVAEGGAATATAADAEGGGGGGGEAEALSRVLQGGGGARATGSGGAAPAVAAGVAAAAAAVEAELREEIAFLKHELGELQAALKRSEKGLQLTFLKNVLVRFLKEGDLENALPVLAQGFEFSPQEVKDIRDTRQGGLRGAAARFGLW